MSPCETNGDLDGSEIPKFKYEIQLLRDELFLRETVLNNKK